MYTRLSLAFIPLLLLSSGLLAQTTDTLENTQDDLAIMAKYYGDSVVLRWMPVDAYFWKAANEVGYTVVRFTLPTDTITYADRELKQLTDTPLKPLPLEAWEALGDKNDAAAVAAMALYGESFTDTPPVDPVQQGLIAALKAQEQDRNNRHFFTALAADQSPVVADALGLRWVDKEITPGRKYIYWVHLADTTSAVKMDTASVAVETHRVITPVPVGIRMRTVENGVRVIWDKPVNQLFFSGYYIERAASAEGPFERLNDVPFVKVDSELEVDTVGIISYLDTLVTAYQPYYYRVIGLDYFGDFSPPSDTVPGMLRDIIPPARPAIFPAQFNENDHVQLQWQKEETEPDLAGFYVVRSPFNDGPFTKIHRELLPVSQRTYTDTSTNSTEQYYYRIAAVDTARNSSYSFNAFVFAHDSIPPPAPEGLVGEVDSLGQVHLHWHPVQVSDLRGYRLFRANAADHTFMQVNTEDIVDTLYVDTISLKTVTKHIYYRLVAYDANYNTSPYAGILELQRYDIIPPAPSVFYDYQVGEGEVTLRWHKSASKDVIEQILYRQQDDEDWEEFISLDTTVTQYSDTTLQSSTFYRYALGTVDESGLTSQKSPAIGIKTGNLSSAEGVQGIEIQYDETARAIQLSWEFTDQESVNRFLIYRAYNDSGLRSYKTITSEDRSFIDQAVRQKGEYQYAVRVIYNNGQTSTMSAVVQNTIE